MAQSSSKIRGHHPDLTEPRISSGGTGQRGSIRARKTAADPRGHEAGRGVATRRHADTDAMRKMEANCLQRMELR